MYSCIRIFNLVFEGNSLFTESFILAQYQAQETFVQQRILNNGNYNQRDT